MKITIIPFQLEIINDKDRSPGLHASDLIRSIGFKLGYLAPQYLNQEMNAEIISIGMAWEDFLAKHQHPSILYHPGEFMKDGIAMSPDGISFENGVTYVHEFKSTRKSLKRESDLESEWLWICQIKNYCYAVGTLLARLHVLWLNGDYVYGTPGGNPQYRIYQLEFTQKELDDNWLMLKNYAKSIGKV